MDAEHAGFVLHLSFSRSWNPRSIGSRLSPRSDVLNEGQGHGTEEEGSRAAEGTADESFLAHWRRREACESSKPACGATSEPIGVEQRSDRAGFLAGPKPESRREAVA
jgi:hypothetical protein